MRGSVCPNLSALAGLIFVDGRQPRHILYYLKGQAQLVILCQLLGNIRILVRLMAVVQQ